METISQRDFANKLGVNEALIRRCIKQGKILKGVTLVNNRPRIIYSIAKEEAEAAGIGLKTNKVKPEERIKELEKSIKELSKFVDPSSHGNNASQVDTELGIMPYAKAIQYKENWLARIRELEYLEKKETLVNKADVYSQLFDFGKEIRSEFESLPGRIGSKIVSIGNDVSEVEKLLANEIRNSLSKLVENMEARKIN